MRAAGTKTTFEILAIFSFKSGQGRVEQLAFGNDHDVEARRDVVTTENLSYQSFSSISLNSAAELFRRCDTQPPDCLLIREDEQRGVTSVDARPMFVDGLK